jgi:hypothetical protein
MNKYRKSLLVTSLIISIPSLFLFGVGVIKLSLTHLVFWGGMLVLWWGMYFYLRQGTKLAFWLSFGLVNLFWWPLLWRTGSRVLFVLENGGMESADGYGSPLAFLIGLVGEQLFFLPLCFSILFGVLTIKGFNKSIQPTANASAD